MNNQEQFDTIVASATAPIMQAISIIRVSGTKTFSIINKIFDKNIMNIKKTTAVHGFIKNDNQLIDEVMAICYKAPNSFTGEDVIEINCHGGVLLTNKIIALIISKGARLAHRGEFSQRAFLNNKIDLMQADAINDLIRANNEDASIMAVNTIAGKTKPKLKKITDMIIALIANIEVNIDYPEYDDVEQLTTQSVIPEIDSLISTMQDIIFQSNKAKLINDGIKTVIVGQPNVGKSSLLNALIGEQKAIVSNIKGTTRDTVESDLNLGFATLKLIDTAGIHTSSDELENQGINRSKAAISKADLVIVVLDSNQKLNNNDINILNDTKSKQRIIVLNKSDLIQHLKLDTLKLTDKIIKLSSLKKEIDGLILAIKNKVTLSDFVINQDLLLTNTRQIGLMYKAKELLIKARLNLKNNLPLDIVSLDIQDAWYNLKLLTGEASTINLLDEIFSRFCLGK